MTSTDRPDSHTRLRRRRLACVGLIFVLAMAMGWPAMSGGFVGGDDHRLVLNHVFVNHPSVAHAIQLFSIVHRDLYQPLPLLTFQAEFIVANLFGLFEQGAERGAWLFHFDNMWLHAVNALLVGAVLSMLKERKDVPPRREAEPIEGSPAGGGGAPTSELRGKPGRGTHFDTSEAEKGAWAVAWGAALLFAVHPFQVEVVAWINGRMMLLSTLFALASMLTFARWLERGKWHLAILTVVLVLLSAISKVRVGVPLLLLVVALARREKLSRRFWWVWMTCALVIGAFVVVNIRSTAQADLFAGGAEHLLGPRAVRVLMALAFYFQHFVWPIGQASYYPTPPVVRWTDPETLKAVLIVAFSLAVLAWFSWRSRACLLGALWFFVGIGDTLPFFPARNVLAADRYMYLPIIGLLWFTVSVGFGGYRRWTIRSSTAVPRVAVGVVGGVTVCAMIGVCWRIAPAYTTPLRKTERIATLFPHVPRVWEQLGWSYYRVGDYAKAIECANKELVHTNPSVQSGAYQLLGMSKLKRGDVEEGLRLLHRARAIAPDDPLTDYRLGVGYEELARYEEALPYLEAAVEGAPQDNPTIHRLVRVLRRLDHFDDARAMCEKILRNNNFDIEAVIALVELDIEAGTSQAYSAAEQRLTAMLGHMPGETRLQSNLGVIRHLLETDDEAFKLATRAFVALTDGRYEEAAARTERLCAAGDVSNEARAWLLDSLKRYDSQNPDVPWTYAMTVRLLIADNQIEAASAFLGLFETQCDSDACRAQAALLRAKVPAPGGTVMPPPCREAGVAEER